MVSRKIQLHEVKAALGALQDDLNEAKEERKAAKGQLEKATTEQDIQKFKALYEGAVANLTGLQREKEELLKRETLLTRTHSSSDDETQEISPVSDNSPKRRKIDSMIARSKKYLLRTLKWGCVTVIGRRRAITFAHKEHRFLKSEIEINQMKDNMRANGRTDSDINLEIKTFVSNIKLYSIEKPNVESESDIVRNILILLVKTNSESDWVLLECDRNLCEVGPKIGFPMDGRDYIQFGLSATSQEDSPLSTSKGVISSSRLNQVGHFLGSAGANPGDSGGPCFDMEIGELVGMNVGCENTPVYPDNDTLTDTYNKISSRYAARAHIVPVSSFLFNK